MALRGEKREVYPADADDTFGPLRNGAYPMLPVRRIHSSWTSDLRRCIIAAKEHNIIAHVRRKPLDTTKGAVFAATAPRPPRNETARPASSAIGFEIPSFPLELGSVLDLHTPSSPASSDYAHLLSLASSSQFSTSDRAGPQKPPLHLQPDFLPSLDHPRPFWPRKLI